MSEQAFARDLNHSTLAATQVSSVSAPGPDSTPLGRQQFIIAAAIGLAATIWLVFLSGWLGATHGSLIMKRQNVLFDSDTNLWIGRMIGNDKSLEQIVHPLEIPLWRVPCRAMAHIMRYFVSRDNASILGPRVLVDGIAGLGIASLALLALYCGVRPLRCALLFVIYLLFTSNTTISLPEHFGISNGLLTLAFVVSVLVSSARMRTTALAVLTVLTGGTSVTGGMVPVICMLNDAIKSLRRKMTLLLIAIPTGIGASMLLYHVSKSIQRYFGLYATFRWTHHPLMALNYTIHMLVLPAVGPAPGIMRLAGWDMVSYEPHYAPLGLDAWLGLQGLGAIAWFILLFQCLRLALRREFLQPHLLVLFAWLFFNVVFYNVWGRELMLWAPAWSWVLMAVVVMGARDLPLKRLLTLFVPIVASQIYTLLAIKSALLTITE
ncbi:MAG TPA: hypothetical protein VK789_09820 [Bryobacteraceae bacterium]|nr:hypothetical protein [Bryobacteraceae bacterium]